MLDNLYDRFNVYAVVSFASNNNLSVPYTYNAATATQSLPASWLEPDAKVNAMVADLYNKTVSLKDAPKVSEGGGDFLSWHIFIMAGIVLARPGGGCQKRSQTVLKTRRHLLLMMPVLIT